MEFHDWDHMSEKQLLFYILKGINQMALDLSKLTEAVSKLSADVTALVNADQTAINASAAGAAAQLAADQAAVDAIVPSLTAISTFAEAALTPKPVAAPPAA